MHALSIKRIVPNSRKAFEQLSVTTNKRVTKFTRTDESCISADISEVSADISEVSADISESFS